MGMVRDPLVRRIIYGDGRRLPNQMADTNNGIGSAVGVAGWRSSIRLPESLASHPDSTRLFP